MVLVLPKITGMSAGWSLRLLTVKTDRFSYGIKAALISEFETVGENLFRAINTDHDTVEFMNIHTCREGFTCEAIGPDRRIIQAGLFSAPLQRYVNFMRYLGGQAVKR
jgi:hypothetical protein